MADFCSDFCCPITIIIVLFLLYFALSDLFLFIFCSISLIYGQFVYLPVLIVNLIRSVC